MVWWGCRVVGLQRGGVAKPHEGGGKWYKVVDFRKLKCACEGEAFDDVGVDMGVNFPSLPDQL